MLIYDYLDDHLLFLVAQKQKDFSLLLAKRILKDALRGLAELHDQGIVHTGIAYVRDLLHKTDTWQISNQTTSSSSGTKVDKISLLTMFVLEISKIRRTFRLGPTSEDDSSAMSFGEAQRLMLKVPSTYL